jgi:hypothetical protein
MKFILLTFISLFGIATTAHADVWMWIDARGESHFVNTQTPIYAWVDSSGRVHYSDTPDRNSAISVKFVWYSPGTLQDQEQATAKSESGGAGRAGETEAEREERERAQAYYCKRATEVYESYLHAPQLYRTTKSGKREYLSKQEKAETIAETRAQKDEFCQ